MDLDVINKDFQDGVFPNESTYNESFAYEVSDNVINVTFNPAESNAKVERISKSFIDPNALRGVEYTIHPNPIPPIPNVTKNNSEELTEEQEDSMGQETYSKNEIDLKLESISSKMDSKFELLSQKIDSGFSNQSLQLDNSLLEFKQVLKDESEKERKEREQAKKESVRWYVGIVFTIIGTGIAIAGTVAAFLALT
ncbi:MAG: hypothetical protein LKK07_05010 [Lactococcus lactis]|jgi:hypothetical protein|nr:hypothetical protein [Lactococcus lactis]MCI2190042.1 hypothetical protein [Lactococcus lactis]